MEAPFFCVHMSEGRKKNEAGRDRESISIDIYGNYYSWRKEGGLRWQH